MSIKDLVAEWEEALGVALSQPHNEDSVTEQQDDALTYVASGFATGVRIRSNVQAGKVTLSTVLCCL